MLSSLALALALASAPVVEGPCLGADADGSFARCFDPGNRLALGLAPGLALGGSTRSALRLDFGLRLRRARASRTRSALSWSTEHTLGEGHWTREGAGARLRLIAYDGLYLRHLPAGPGADVEEGFIVLPTREPARIPFPFDLAITARLGEWTHAPGVDRLEVARLGLLLDVLRDPRGARRLALGPALAYGLEWRRGARPVHRLQPLTGATLLLRGEDAAGLRSAQLRVDAGWEASFGGRSGISMQAEGELERVLFAVDDQPVSARLSVSARAEAGAPEPAEALVSLGLIAAIGL